MRCCSGVFGGFGLFSSSGLLDLPGADASLFVAEELSGSCTMGFTVCEEMVGDPEAEVRRRLREQESLSSKGFGRVELGSGEAAASGRSVKVDVGSIWLVRKTVMARSLEVQRRHDVARAVRAATAEN